jgi:hypothetical protein
MHQQTVPMVWRRGVSLVERKGGGEDGLRRVWSLPASCVLVIEHCVA